MKLIKLSLPSILRNLSVERYQIFLDTGYYDGLKYSKTWDMLEWLQDNKEKNL